MCRIETPVNFDNHETGPVTLRSLPVICETESAPNIALKMIAQGCSKIESHVYAVGLAKVSLRTAVGHPLFIPCPLGGASGSSVPGLGY